MRMPIKHKNTPATVPQEKESILAMPLFNLPVRVPILHSLQSRFVKRLAAFLLVTAKNLDALCKLQLPCPRETAEYYFPPKGAYPWDAKCRNCYATTQIFSHSRVGVACWKCESLLCEPTPEKVRCTEACFPHHAIDDYEMKCGNCFSITKFLPPPSPVECRKCKAILRELIDGISYTTNNCRHRTNGLECRNCLATTRAHSPIVYPVVCCKCQVVLLESRGLHEGAAYLSPSQSLSDDDDDHFHPKEESKTFVSSPGSFYMDVRCGLCGVLTTINGRSRLPVECWGCQNVLCRPTGGGRVRLIFAVSVKEFSG